MKDKNTDLWESKASQALKPYAQYKQNQRFYEQEILLVLIDYYTSCFFFVP